MEKLIVEILNENEDYENYEFPAKYAVCDHCNGNGTHVNPNIDGNGITSDEMAELGPDFREDYLSGVYDVICGECKGKRVVLEIDTERLTKDDEKAFMDSRRGDFSLRVRDRRR